MTIKYVSLGCCLFLISCVSRFDKVDFKYSNLAHMSIRDCFVEVKGPPEEIVFGLSEALRNQGAAIFQRQKIASYPEVSEYAFECETAVREVRLQEFAAYEKNDFSEYSKIDRLTPFTSRKITSSCLVIKDHFDPTGENWVLAVDLNPRASASTVFQPTMNSIFLTDGTTMVHGAGFGQRQSNVTQTFETRLSFYVWRRAEAKNSTVYIHARPINNQVVSCNGCAIGHAWWKSVNGYQESLIVRNYVALLEEVSRSGKTFSQLRN